MPGLSVCKRPWWRSAVIYQIYPRSFADENGDGLGDLDGIITRLDYLADHLGVDAIWLSPFYPSPMADFGYDIADHCDVDPRFGDLATFDHLLAACQARAIKVIVDFVPNHTSDQHRWFVDAKSAKDSEHRGFYVWADPADGGRPPNNWLSAFGGPAWTLDRSTGQYFLHSFLPEQPDLNWRNPAVKRAMFDVLRFWLDRGVDGFRIDVAHFVMKDPSLRDNPPAPTGKRETHRDRGAYDTQLHLHNRGHADIHPLFRELRQLLESYTERDAKERLAVGEIHVFDWPRWIAYYGEQLDELHFPVNFGLLTAKWEAQAIRRQVEELESALPEGAWPNYVLGNHDEPRLASRIGEKQARVAAMLLLTLRGTPTLYYGDELGMIDAVIPADRRRDPAGRDDPVLGRDPCRTPMPWDGGINAGFCPGEVEPWLPVGDENQKLHVACQLADERSMLALYRQLLTLRRASDVLRLGSIETIDDGVPAACFAYRRVLGELSCVVALNFSDREQRLALTLPSEARVLLSTGLDRHGPLVPGKRFCSVPMKV